VILGNYSNKTSPINLPMSVTYLHARLAGGQTWVYQPNANQKSPGSR